MTKPFDGLVAIVTGAGRGIGKAIGLRLAAQGARVAFVARTPSEISAAAAEAGPDALAMACDISRDGGPELMLEHVMERFGRLDILVHSAGTITQERIEHMNLTAFDDMLRVNLRAPYALTQTALAALKETRGQVLFINSTITRAQNIAGRGGFAATQHALKAIADSLRDEVNEAGVRVISLIAGTTATARQEHLHQLSGKPYHPELLLQAADVAQAACDALAMPRTAEITDVVLRPMQKS